MGRRGRRAPRPRREGGRQRNRSAPARRRRENRRRHRGGGGPRPRVRDALVLIERLDVTISKGCGRSRATSNGNSRKMDAERVVRRLDGVKGVTNLITVKPRVTPSEIKTESRAGTDPKRRNRRAAHHRRGRWLEADDAQGRGPLLGGAGGGRARGVVGTGSHAG